MGGREPVITIDGPAGAGKGTVARALAARLGYRLLDTGSMYRALAWSVARAGLQPDDTPALRRHVERVQIDLEGDRVLVDGRDVTDEIRTPEIANLTSRLSMLAIVRDKLTPLQRRLAVDRRAWCWRAATRARVVCPDAEVKFYLDASLEERARRRQAELRARGIELEPEAARREIAARDAPGFLARAGAAAPAPDAVEVDTTGLERGPGGDRAGRGDRAPAPRRPGVRVAMLYATLKWLAVAIMRLLFRVEGAGDGARAGHRAAADRGQPLELARSAAGRGDGARGS